MHFDRTAIFHRTMMADHKCWEKIERRSELVRDGDSPKMGVGGKHTHTLTNPKGRHLPLRPATSNNTVPLKQSIYANLTNFP